MSVLRDTDEAGRMGSWAYQGQDGTGGSVQLYIYIVSHLECASMPSVQDG